MITGTFPLSETGFLHERAAHESVGGDAVTILKRVVALANYLRNPRLNPAPALKTGFGNDCLHLAVH